MTKAYPSNLTWEQWELIADLFPTAKSGGRPRTIGLFTVVNAIFYVLCEGCTWRGNPWDFPAWATVYGYFRRWRKAQYGSVKTERVGDDMKTGSEDLYSSTSMFWFF